LRHGLCMCAIHRVNGHNKTLKCLWTGYGSRCKAHRFVSRTAMLLSFSTLNSFPCVSRMVHHPNDIQTTWHNCGKHWSHHGPASLWNAWHLVETMPWWIGCTNTCFNSPPSRFTWSFHFPEIILLVVEQLQVDYLQWVHCSLPTYSFSGTLYKRDHSSVLFYGCRIRTKYLFLVSHIQAQSSNLKVKIVFKREKKRQVKAEVFFSPLVYSPMSVVMEAVFN
jgi:hypothetical protein